MPPKSRESRQVMLESAFERIERDLHRLSIEVPSLTILHRMTSHEVGASLPALGDSALEEPQANEFLVQFGTHWFRHFSEGTEASLAAGVLSVIQDDVIGELGRPWPELTIDNRFPGVLEPSPSGVGVWASRRGYSCPIGALDATFGRFIAW